MTRRRLVWTMVLVAVVYAAVSVDVVLRARHAYLEGEKAPSAQLAYAWYESAATLFIPPESKWSRMAREKLPATKEKWRAELRAKGIPFTESMLE